MEKLAGDLDKWTMLFKKAVIADMSDIHNQIKHENDTKLSELEHQHISKLKIVEEKLMSLNSINSELQKKADLKNDFLERSAEVMCRSVYQRIKHRYYSLWTMKYKSNQVAKLKEKTTTVIYERQLKRRVLEGWKGKIENSREKVYEKRVKIKHDKDIHDLSEKYEYHIITLQKQVAQLANQLSHAQSSKDQYEAKLKQAFMQGLSTLNEPVQSSYQPQERLSNPQVLTENIELNGVNTFLYKTLPLPLQEMLGEYSEYNTPSHTPSNTLKSNSKSKPQSTSKVEIKRGIEVTRYKNK